MATKRKQFGSKASYSANGSSYTALTDVASIKWPKATKEKADSTHLESPNQHKEYLADGGWGDTDDLTITAFFTESQFSTLVSKYDSPTTEYWRIQLPLLSGQTVNAQLVLQGHVMSYEPLEVSAGNNDPVKATFTIGRDTDKVVFTAGS